MPRLAKDKEEIEKMYCLITEEEAARAEQYDALMEHSEAIANAPKKQTEAGLGLQKARETKENHERVWFLPFLSVLQNTTGFEAYKRLLAIPGSPAARGLGKSASLYQRKRRGKHPAAAGRLGDPMATTSSRKFSEDSTRHVVDSEKDE